MGTVCVSVPDGETAESLPRVPSETELSSLPSSLGQPALSSGQQKAEMTSVIFQVGS